MGKEDAERFIAERGHAQIFNLGRSFCRRVKNTPHGVQTENQEAKK